MLHSPRWEAWDWILIELVSKAARSYEASRVGRKALQTQLTEFWYSASSWKRVKARQAPHPQQSLWIPHGFGRHRRSHYSGKGTGLVSSHEMAATWTWRFLLGHWELVSPHSTGLQCLMAPGPLEGYLHCVSSVNSFEKHNREIGHQAGALPPLLKKLCHGSGFFWTKAREEARTNHLNLCQGAQEEMKFCPLLHLCILNNLTWIS